ncbi:hypothetical protein [Gordonia sp. NPDC003950]
MPKSAPAPRRPSPAGDPDALNDAIAPDAIDPAAIDPAAIDPAAIDADGIDPDAQPSETESRDTEGRASATDTADDDVTPLDGQSFLDANRRNREQIRADAERKADKRRGRTVDLKNTDATDETGGDASAEASSQVTDPDRIPRKMDGSLSSGPRRRRRKLQVAGSRRLFALVAALVAVVIALAVATGVLAYQLADAKQAAAAGPSNADRVAVIDAAKRYAASLSTYDAADYNDLDRRIREVSTPAFAKNFIASSQDARAGNANAKAASTGTVDHAGIESMSDTHAVVLVSIDQKVTSPEVASQVPDGITYQSRASVTLTREDGRWLLDGFEVDN